VDGAYHVLTNGARYPAVVAGARVTVSGASRIAWTTWMGDIQLEESAHRLVHAGLTLWSPVYQPYPVSDQYVFSRVRGDTMFYSVHNVARALAKITTTTSGLPECHEHVRVCDPECARCRRAYVDSALMLRARAFCLLGSGVCLEPLNYFCHAMMGITDVLVRYLNQAHRDRLMAVLGRTDERRKMVSLGITAEGLFAPSSHAATTSARFVWTESDREFVRQGVDPDRVRLWVTQLVEFLRCVGPRPAPPIDVGELREGQEWVSVDAPIDYSPAWWATLVGGIQGVRLEELRGEPLRRGA